MLEQSWHHKNARMPRGSSVDHKPLYEAHEDKHKKYDDVKANYLRKTEAERNYEAKHGKL